MAGPKDAGGAGGVDVAWFDPLTLEIFCASGDSESLEV